MKKWDFILIIAVLIACGLLLFSFNLQKFSGKATAEIKVNGQLVKTCVLNKSAVYTLPGYLYPFKIETAPGKIRMLEAHCPDQICVHTGWIESSMQTIVCMPNRVVITIKDARSKEKMDTVAY